MRTTVEFDDDTAKAVTRLRKESGMGVSEAVNCLVRRGLLIPDGNSQGAAPFVQQTHHLGLRIDVSNVADAVDLLEGPRAR